MTSKIGIGIIGAGSIARSHLRAYQAWPDDCRIVATADIAPEKAEEMATAAGADAWYADYDELLRRPDVDLVSICTPPFVHAPATIAALRAGKHVLCEKPMAASPQECDEMIAAAKESGKILSVVFQNRFRPELWCAKKVVDSGLLGRLIFGKCETLWYRGRNYYDLWWRGTWEMECGGATINHAVHDVDAFVWMMGEPVSVYAEMDAQVHDVEVEDISIAIVRFANGALGQVTSTVNCHQNRSALEISGEQAAVTIPWSLSARVPDERGFPRENAELMERLSAFAEEITPPPGQGHGAQVADVLRAIRTGGRPLVDGEEGSRSLRFITALYKSASTGQRVSLPLDPSDPFYTTDGLRAHVKRHPSSRTEKGKEGRS